MTKKPQYLKTTHGSTILPLYYVSSKSSKAISNLIKITAHPEDGTKSFSTYIQTLDVEGGDEAVEVFFSEE